MNADTSHFREPIHFDYERQVTHGMTLCGKQIKPDIDTVGNLVAWDELREEEQCQQCRTAMIACGLLPSH